MLDGVNGGVDELLAAVKSLLSIEYCKTHELQDDVVEALQGLMLSNNKAVRVTVRELVSKKDSTKAEEYELSCQIMVNQAEENLREALLQVDFEHDPNPPTLHTASLSGTLYTEPCTIKLAVPSIDDIVSGDIYFENIARHCKAAECEKFETEEVAGQLHMYEMYNELRLLLKLDNINNVIQVLAYQIKPLPVYYMLERPNMGTLEDELIKRRRSSQFMGLENLMDILIQALEAICYCHQNLICVVSIDTASFGLFGDPSKPQVKLTNFKLGKDMDQAHLHMTG